MPLVDPVTMSATPIRRRVKADKDQTDAPSPAASAASATAPAAAVDVALALAARHGAPLLLLAGLAFSFDGLVADAGSSSAVATLAGLLAVSTAVQVGASVVGLAPAGSDAASLKKRKVRKDLRKSNRIVVTVLSLLLTALSVPAIHAVLVLFGAPFLVHTARTLLCAAHIAVLAVFPVIYTRGTDAPGWLALAAGELSSLWSPSAGTFDVAVAGLWGTAIGAWLGAVPIPLDWDRPWQQWPVTIVVGAYVGYAVGRLLAAVRR